MIQQNELKLAKQDNSQAIAALMNCPLQSRGITAKLNLLTCFEAAFLDMHHIKKCSQIYSQR